MAGTQVPILDSVGGAFRAVRENLRFIAMVAVAGAAILTVLAYLSLVAPLIGLLVTIGSLAAAAYVYTAMTGAALIGAREVPPRLASDGLRVWGAMAIVGFFLCIVFIPVTIVGIIAFIFGAAEYAGEMEAAGQDQAAMMAVFGQIAQDKPFLFIAIALVFLVIWMLLTSRLYLAAPATYGEKRILSFETWKWTKGNMLRITAARLVLLGPAYVLVFAVGWMVATALGFNMFDPTQLTQAAAERPAIFLLVQFVNQLIQFLIYTPLEAALSAVLYQGLRPQNQQVNAF